jgi:K+-sensing histidine kinase KdpD
MLLVFYGINRWYFRYTIRRNKELDAIIEVRNYDLLKVNEQLVEKIKLNDLFQSILVHDIRTPIRFVSSNAKLISENWNNLNENIKKKNLIQIYESTERINSFVEETLFWIQLRNGNLQLKITNFYICSILKENIQLFEDSPKLKSGNIVVVNDCDHQLIVNSDQMLVSTIIRNLLINSIKYTNSGQITLYAFRDRNGKVNFGCKDEGTGIPLDLIEIIMQDDYKGNSINSGRFKMGFVIIKELVKMLNAKLDIKTNGISGTDIGISL